MTAQTLRVAAFDRREHTPYERLLLVLSDAFEHAALRRAVRRLALAERIVRDIEPAERCRRHIIDTYRGGIRP